ncbi:N-methyl-L-tryptophan oxidase [Pullulanibacillus camelliae]|uniref:N-methyl-L-tryptophan oxidase n=1 Tax=Pullulanibacillus camelliae TaxID=1707096 RepID=A0A8J2VJR3_9BACL|nr:N-methyl-L-tryptophan oxidase [Pullulanibacillus camelliae]GGE26432.1 N-methyl-L-tryptophan oxidase [Pullulanibacillus camelliae]
MTTNVYDCIIVGAGTMGLAAGAFLAKSGIKPLMIDAFHPPHTHGSHHGETRMIRHAYGEGRQYVKLVQRAQELWEDLEAAVPYKIFEKTGVLGLGPKHSPFLQETIEAAAKYDLSLDIMSAQGIMQKWPGITVPEHFIGCLESDSGVLFSEHCLKAYKEIALANGAELIGGEPVVDIDFNGHPIKVTTKNSHYYGEKVIITAGAWTAKLLKPLNLPIQTIRKVFGWFEAPESLYAADAFPSFYVDEGTRMFYGFPALNKTGLKIGRTDGGQPIDPNQHKQNFGSHNSDEKELRECLQAYLPQANGSLLNGRTCLQTRSIDSHFIIDEHPDQHNMLIATGFSGHGFKFASVLGEALSEWVLHGATQHDLSLFSLERFSSNEKRNLT